VVDAWRSSNYLDFFGILCSFVDKDWKLRIIALDFAVLQSEHTSEYLADILWRVLEDFEITDKVISVTTDNASNMVAMIRELQKKFERVSQNNPEKI